MILLNHKKYLNAFGRKKPNTQLKKIHSICFLYITQSPKYIMKSVVQSESTCRYIGKLSFQESE